MYDGEGGAAAAENENINSEYLPSTGVVLLVGVFFFCSLGPEKHASLCALFATSWSGRVAKRRTGGVTNRRDRSSSRRRFYLFILAFFYLFVPRLLASIACTLDSRDVWC